MEPIEKLADEIRKARKHTLDFLEKLYGDDPNWVRVRSHILRTFGQQGLEKFIALHGVERGVRCDSDNERTEAVVKKSG